MYSGDEYGGGGCGAGVESMSSTTNTGHDQQQQQQKAVVEQLAAREQALHEQEMRRFEKRMLRRHGWLVNQMNEDGACLFRACGEFPSSRANHVTD